MANTIINPTIFSKEVVKNRDIMNVFYRYANTEYTGDLKKAWDTVNVQTLPTLSFATWASSTAGWVITATDFVITSENLVINQVGKLRVQLKDIEMTQSNLSLEQKIAMRFSEAEARLFDETVRNQILTVDFASIPAANKLNATALVITKTNVFAEFEKLKVALAKQNVTNNLVAFCSPTIASLLRQSDILDWNDLGLMTRKKGYLGMISGIEVVETNALGISTATNKIICMEKGSVNMVAQLNQHDIRMGTDGFYENLIAEIIYGLKIFWENAKAIAVSSVNA